MEKKRIIWDMLLLCCFMIVLAACASNPTPVKISATATPRPTATTLPAGTLLYQADWSHGLAGFPGTHGWQVVQGQLQSAANGDALLTIPYKPAVSNYRIDVHLEIVRLTQEQGGYFSIFATHQSGKDGFQAGVSSLKSAKPRAFGSHPQSQVFIEPTGDMNQGSGIPEDYEPGFNIWHTYSVVVRDNGASLQDNGTQIGYGSSNQTDYLSNGPLGLMSDLVVLRVSSIRIVSM